jgi:DNA polymerase V
MQVTEIYDYCPIKSVLLPLYNNKVQAGFPSPAEDHLPSKLDLNTYLIKHPASTFFVRVVGDSMLGAGIKENDLLIVDRSISATNNKVVIAVINNEFTVKRLKYINKEAYLLPENDNYQPIKLGEGSYIWGVVTSVIHQL